MPLFVQAPIFRDRAMSMASRHASQASCRSTQTGPFTRTVTLPPHVEGEAWNLLFCYVVFFSSKSILFGFLVVFRCCCCCLLFCYVVFFSSKSILFGFLAVFRCCCCCHSFCLWMGLFFLFISLFCFVVCLLF